MIRAMAEQSDLSEVAQLKKSPAERRRDSQRRRILEEAGRLFDENGGETGGGFEKTTVEAIADRSDISPSTFFRYFETKADVIYLDLANTVDDHLRELAAQLDAGQDPIEALLASMTELFDEYVSDEHNRARLLRSLHSKHFEQRRAFWIQRWRDGVAELVRSALPSSADRDLEALIIATTCTRITWVAIEAWGKGDQTAPLEPVLRDSFRLAAATARDAERIVGRLAAAS